MTPEWRAIPGYEGLYEVSNMGNVQSLSRTIKHPHGTAAHQGRVLKQMSDGSGRRQVGLCKNGKPKQFRVHNLVLEAFIGPRPKGMVCCHNDGDASNNRLDNLRWDTQRANVADAQRHGTQHRGERTGNSKLTNEAVEAVKLLAGAGWDNAKISRALRTTTNCIWKVVNERTWTHV